MLDGVAELFGDAGLGLVDVVHARAKLLRNDFGGAVE